MGMQRIRQHFLSRFFCGLVALTILNISVDAPDMQPQYVPEDLSYNEVESLVEFVLEDVLGMENAIPEQDDNDDVNPLKLDKQFVLFFEYETVLEDMPHIQNIFGPKLQCGVEDYPALCVVEALIKPPEA